MAISVAAGRIIYISFWPDARRGRDANGLWHGKWHSLEDDIRDEGRYPDEVIRVDSKAAAFYFGKVIIGCDCQKGLSHFEHLIANTPSYHAKGHRGGFSCSSLVKEILESMLELSCLKTSVGKVVTEDLMGLRWKELGIGLLSILPAGPPQNIKALTLAEIEYLRASAPKRMKKIVKESKAVTPNFFQDAFSAYD